MPGLQSELMLRVFNTYLEKWHCLLSPWRITRGGMNSLALAGEDGVQQTHYQEDEGLVDRARYGDHGAFRQLFERYSPLVYRVAYRMVGSPDDAADITQDVFVRAFERLVTLKNGQAFQAWITRLTVNIVRDTKRRRRLDTTSLDAPLNEYEDAVEWSLPSSDPPVDQRMLTHELSEQIQTALLQLSPEHRAVIILHHLENIPVEEIGTTLQLPVGTVKSRLARARAELRRRLDSYLSPDA